MKKLNLPNDCILTKKELVSISGGGGFLCSCLDDDGYQVLLPDEASSAEHCAEMCRAYWERERQ